MNGIEPVIFVGQSFDVYQNSIRCVSGIINTTSEFDKPINFSKLPSRVAILSHGEICEKIGKLTITKLKDNR